MEINTGDTAWVLVATLPGSTYATAATNAGPSNRVRCSSASLCSNINSNALTWSAPCPQEVTGRAGRN